MKRTQQEYSYIHQRPFYKRGLAIALALVMALSVVIGTAPRANAAMVPETNGNCNIEGYVLATTGTVTLYRDVACTSINSSVPVSQRWTIQKLDSTYNSFYLTSSTQSGWMPSSSFTSMSDSLYGTPVVAVAQADVTTYKKSDAAETLGTIPQGRSFFVLETQGSMTRVVYPSTNNGYIMAWALNTNLFPFKEGDYKLRSVLDSTYCVDVYGASQDAFANVQIYHDNNESNAQGFTITHVKDGWYKIQNMGSGLVLDVANGSRSSGTNVWQCGWNGTDAQLWQIINNGGSYFLRNKLGCYLDVYDGKASNGTNIWVYSFNASNAQRFTFTQTRFADGNYKIHSLLSKDYCIDVYDASSADFANIWLYRENTESNAQNFTISHVSDGWYKIQNIGSGKVLDVANGSRSSGTNVWQCSWNGTDAQLWKIISVGDGSYYLKNKLGCYLDVYDGKAANGTNIWVYNFNGSTAQRFSFSPAKAVTPPTPAFTATIPEATSRALDFQMPMDNAYCTWRSPGSNMSWGAYTSNSSGRNYHLGLDIYGRNGAVYATAPGTVVASSDSNRGANGRYLIIRHDLNGKTIYSFYAHLSTLYVSNGSTVDRNTQIAVAGGSGYGRNNYYGTHLHFAIVDTLWSSGGYYGYSTYFSSGSRYYQGVTYYNPLYVINNDKLP